MRTAACKTNNKIYKLDDETLFLLRIRAMEDVPAYQTNRKFTTEEELRSHINSISETKAFFASLKCAIGEADGCRRRTPISLVTMWKDISYLFRYRSKDPRRNNNKAELQFVADTFGYKSINELSIAAQQTDSTPPVNCKVGVDVQDRIANVFGYKSWIDFTNIDKKKYLVSESVLQRAFGLYNIGSALSLQILNYITQYICDMNWQTYDTPSGRKEARKKILSRVVKPAMKTVINDLVAQTKAKAPQIPGVKEGDIIKIEHADGTMEILRFADGEFHQMSGNNEMCA